MRILICVDDTDDLTKETSTGKIADLIAEAITGKKHIGGSGGGNGGGKGDGSGSGNGGGQDAGAEPKAGRLISGVTRHQLLLHEDIDYTSHNSSMCMEIETERPLDEMIREAEKVLKSNMAATSDPGLCFCVLDELKDPDALIAYGRKAKREVIYKDEAYAVAEKIGGTKIIEYGARGNGVIGALAGTGLRLSGNDGTFRGGKGSRYAHKTMTAGQWKSVMNVELVVDMDGNILDDGEQVTAQEKIKMALMDGKRCLVAMDADGHLMICEKKDLYEGDHQINKWSKPCDDFVEDNDLGECYSEGEKACWNCLFRRWTAEGYTCVKDRASEQDG